MMKNTALQLSFLLAWVIPMCHGAGMTAHNVAARRGLRHYKEVVSGFEDLAKNNWASISAGAPFPDYLYTCGDYHGAGEEAHWPPFQSAAAEYIRANWTLDQILTEERPQQLTAFMMGMVSHYITDLNWHGLDVVPSPQGFIEQVGVTNYNCSGDLNCRDGTAHKTCDVGGEFVAAYELNLDFYEPQEWVVPVEDLVNIFAYANATMDPTTDGECYEGDICFPLIEPEWVTNCAYLFGVGSWAVKEFGDLIWPFWEQTALNGGYGAPHLTEAFVTWPVGGMDDDAMWTAAMWNRWETWLLNGPPAVIPHASPPTDFSSSPSPSADWREQEQARRLHSKKKKNKRSTASLDLYRGMRSIVSDLQQRKAIPFEAVQVSSSSTASTMTTADDDGGPTSSSSAGAYGVKIRNMMHHNKHNPASTSSNYSPVAATAVSSAEAWREGAFELAEALAMAAGIGQEQEGSALPANLSKALKARANELFPLPSTPPVTTEKEQVEKDSSSSTGGGGSRGISSSDGNDRDGNDDGNDDDQVQQVLYGNVALEYHGSSLASADLVALYSGQEKGQEKVVGVATTDGCADAIVGSPGYGDKGAPQRGRVQVYSGICGGVEGEDSSTSAYSLSPEPSLVLLGTSSDHGRFGASLAVGDLDGDGVVDLVIGAPTSGSLNVNASVGNYTGKVFLRLSSSSSVAGHGDNENQQLLDEIVCDVSWANFGTSLAIGDLNGDGQDDLVVGAPFAGDDDDQGEDSGEGGGVNSAGRVYVFLGPITSSFFSSSTSGSGRVLFSSSSADLILTGGTDFSWFGSRVEVFKGGQEQESLLLVSAPAHRLEGTTGSVGRLDCFSFTTSSSVTTSLEEARTHHPTTTNQKSTQLIKADLAWRIEGDTWMAKTGFSFAVQQASMSSPLIAVSSPTMDGGLRTRNQSSTTTTTMMVESESSSSPSTLRNRHLKHAGQVVLVELKQLASVGNNGSTISWSALASLPGSVVLHGSHRYGRLGWRLAFASSSSSNKEKAGEGEKEDNVLIMAAPLSEREKGRIYEFDVRRMRTALGRGSNNSSSSSEAEVVAVSDDDTRLDERPWINSFAPAPQSSRFGESDLVFVAPGRVLIGAPRVSNTSESGEMLGAAYLMALRT